MGLISDMRLILGVAMEAEDITKDATSGAEDLTGGGSNKPDKSDSNDISLNTDNVLADDNDPPKDNNTNGDNNDGDPADEPSNDNPDDMDENMDGQTDEDGDGDNLPEAPSDDNNADDAMASKNDPFEASRKLKLWDDFKHFYTTLDDSIKLISKHVPTVSNADTIKTLSSIKENMIKAKEMIYKILTDDLSKASYPDLQKKYIGLNHIYDICINQLKKYFDEINKEKDTK